MSLQELIISNPWQTYSKKLKEKIEKPRFSGFFTARLAQEKKMRLVTGSDGSIEEGSKLTLYWLVDTTDGVIADAKFQVFGLSALIGAAEVICELVIRKNYDQASRISADLIDQHVRDRKNQSAFPKEYYFYLNQVISAIDQAVYACRDIPFASDYESTPIAFDTDIQVLENWPQLSKETKMKIVEEVIDKEIRPYIELDAGGVKVTDIQDVSSIYISYEGNCVSCYAATGSTLSAIQQILQSRIHPSITVIPVL